MFDNDTFERGGHNFRVQLPFDEDMGAPWEKHDGHGIISEWTSRDKAPGERVLCEDHGHKRYYDIKATIAIAKKDGWGCSHGSLKDGKYTHSHKTKKEAVACAVDQDFERMKAWCNDEWHWCGVVVTMLNDEDEETELADSLWGIEDDSDDYLDDVANELADNLIARQQKELQAWNSLD